MNPKVDVRTYPARLHILLARDAPIGLVIRRAPKDEFVAVLWDREKDEFRVGQFLKGRIYGRRSDLSPDGKFFIYFAANRKWDRESKGAWTAVSVAPYLKALALYPKGDLTEGGGLWLTAGTYWVNQGPGEHSPLFETHLARRDYDYKPEIGFGDECLNVYFLRLLRDGWVLKEQNSRYVFERPLPHGWILRKLVQADIVTPSSSGAFRDTHTLVDTLTNTEREFPDWEWAELDQERVVWSTSGKLMAAQLNPNGLAEEKLLRDFNGMAWQSLIAPY